MLYWFVLLGPVLLLTVLVHELGHCLAARQVGGSATGILLWPLGGLAYIGHAAGPKGGRWQTGCLVNVPFFRQRAMLIACWPAHWNHAFRRDFALQWHAPQHFLQSTPLT